MSIEQNNEVQQSQVSADAGSDVSEESRLEQDYFNRWEHADRPAGHALPDVAEVGVSVSIPAGVSEVDYWKNLAWGLQERNRALEHQIEGLQGQLVRVSPETPMAPLKADSSLVDWKLRARVADLVHLLPAEVPFLEGDKATAEAALADIRRIIASPGPQTVEAVPARWHMEVLENEYETRLTLWAPDSIGDVSFAVPRDSSEASALRAFATARAPFTADDNELLPARLPGQLETDIPWRRIHLEECCTALTSTTEFDGAMLWRGWHAMRDQLERQAEEAKHAIKAQVWHRESTNEWVLELSGTINDQFFIVRHTEPMTTAKQDVAGLPSLYARVHHVETGDVSNILKEAASVLQAVAPEHQPANWRGPLVDELEGFAGMLKPGSPMEHAVKLVCAECEGTTYDRAGQACSDCNAKGSSWDDGRPAVLQDGPVGGKEHNCGAPGTCYGVCPACT